jgi:hypothetical protein
MKALLAAACALVAFSALPASAGPNDAKGGDTVVPLSTEAPACSECFAVVRSNGTVARGRGVLRAARIGAGTYEVIFRNKLTPCAFSLTPARIEFSGTVPPTIITGAGRVGTNNGVFIETFNTAGVHTDQPFHLVITC